MKPARPISWNTCGSFGPLACIVDIDVEREQVLVLGEGSGTPVWMQLRVMPEDVRRRVLEETNRDHRN